MQGKHLHALLYFMLLIHRTLFPNNLLEFCDHYLLMTEKYISCHRCWSRLFYGPETLKLYFIDALNLLITEP